MTPDNLQDPNSPELTPPPTPISNTEIPPSSSSQSVDTTGNELFFATLREKNAEIARLKEENSRTRQATPKVGEEAWGEFTNSPRDLIRSEIAEAVKPLNEFVQMMKQGNAFQGLKQQAAGMNPFWAKVLEKAGNLVDQVLSNANPTLDNVVAAINLVVGMIASGQVKGITLEDLNGKPTVHPTPKVTPPTIPPSSSPLSKQPDKDGAKPWDNLTETELAMARVYRMTPQQYYEQSRGDSIEVDTTKGGGKK